MDVRTVLVILTVLMRLSQVSGETVNINLNIGGNREESVTLDKSQDAVIAELVKQAEGLHQDTAGRWLSQLDTLDMSDIGRDILIGLLLEQNKKMQDQIKDQASKHDDLKKQVKIDLRHIQKTCCNKTPCPSGYEWFCEKPDMCYKFSNESDRKNYTDARSACQAAGGHLAMPKDKATNDFLFKQIKTKFSYRYVWIGLTDQVQEGTWVWDDGKILGKGWNNWAAISGLNSFQRDPSYDCALWRPYTNKWIDNTCTYNRNYICEVKTTAAP